MTANSLKASNPAGVWGADTPVNRDGFYPSIKTTLKPVTRVNYLPERDADKSPILECIDLGISFGGLGKHNHNIYVETSSSTTTTARPAPSATPTASTSRTSPSRTPSAASR